MDNKCHNVMFVIKDYANNYDSYIYSIGLPLLLDPYQLS